MRIINTFADLEAIAGTARHAAITAGLVGTVVLAGSPPPRAAKLIAAPVPALSAGQQARWDGSAWIVEAIPPAPAPAPPAAQDVVAERERRLAAGFDYDFGDARGTHRFGTTRQDMVGWDEVTQAAEALRATSQGAAAIDIVTETGPVSLTADEWPAVLVAAAAFRQPIWQASFAIGAMDPIPADYDADSRWP